MPDSPQTIADTLSKKARSGADTASAATSEGFDQARQAAGKTRQTLEDITAKGADTAARAFDAYADAGRKAQAVVGEVNKAMGDAYAQSLSDFNDLSKQAMTCRTAMDIVTLQSNAAAQFQQRMSTMAQIYGMMLKGMTTPLLPLTIPPESTAKAATL